MDNNSIKKEYIKYIMSRKIVTSTKKDKIRMMSQYVDMLIATNSEISKTGIAEIEEFIARKNYLSIETINRFISNFKELYRFLKQQQLLEVDCIHLIKYRKKPKRLPRNLNHALMIKLCTPTDEELVNWERPLQLRNQAIIEFLYSTGIRNSELRELRFSQLSSDLRRCWVIAKKGSNDRFVFLGKYARITLWQYLQVREINCENLPADKKNEFVFWSSRKQKMSSQALKNAVEKLAIKRISAPVTPHMIRHTFATDMLRSYNCLRTLQKLLGHKNINSTAKYCHLVMVDKNNAIEAFHPRNNIDNKQKNN